MDRRRFLRYGLSAVPTSFGPFGLLGCGGGDTNDVVNPGPGPVCAAGTFAKGLNPATDAILSGIPTATNVTFLGLAGTGTVAGLPTTTFPTYFDLTDAQLMAQYGFPIG